MDDFSCAGRNLAEEHPVGDEEVPGGLPCCTLPAAAFQFEEDSVFGGPRDAPFQFKRFEEDEAGGEAVPGDVVRSMLVGAVRKAHGQHVSAFAKGGEPRLRLAAQQRLCLGDAVRVAAVAKESQRQKWPLLGKRGRVVKVSRDATRYQVELLGDHWFLEAELEFDAVELAPSCDYLETASCSTMCSSPSSRATDEF